MLCGVVWLVQTCTALVITRSPPCIPLRCLSITHPQARRELPFLLLTNAKKDEAASGTVVAEEDIEYEPGAIIHNTAQHNTQHLPVCAAA